MDRDRQTETPEAARQPLPHQGDDRVGPDLVSPEAIAAPQPAQPPTLGRQAPGFSLPHADG